jgi:hypothetical protein
MHPRQPKTPPPRCSAASSAFSHLPPPSPPLPLPRTRLWCAHPCHLSYPNVWNKSKILTQHKAPLALVPAPACSAPRIIQLQAERHTTKPKASQGGLGTVSRRDHRRNVHAASLAREAGAREGGQWKRRCDKRMRAPEVPEHLHGRRLELQTEYVAQQAGQTEVSSNII